MERKSMIRIVASIVMITLLIVPFSFLLISQNVSAGSYDILHEDFEGSLTWITFDNNPTDGLDYWGLSDYKSSSGSWSVWCAQIGTRSSTGNPNTVDRKYDDNMDALIYTDIGDISGYTTVTLYYAIWYALDTNIIFADDELWVISSPDASTWTIERTYIGSNSVWENHNVAIPTTAQYVGFWLWSRDGEELEGVYIDEVSVVGIETTKPSSSVGALPTYETTSSFDITCSANDGSGQSGVNYVEIYYRKDGTGGYTKYTTAGNPSGQWTSSPISFDSSTTGGDGSYEFYTIATDNANNVEDAPASADTTTFVDATEPTSLVSSLPTYSSTSTLSIGYNADDNVAGSGLQYVELYYNTDGSGWNKYGTTFTSSPLSFDTTTTGGDGTYQFYTLATDNAGNIETPPAGNDTWTIVDIVNPTSYVSTMPSYQSTLTFDVPFIANDDGSGIQFIEIYYTTDGGTLWSKYGTTFISSPITFTASSDGTYGFFTVATDNADNVEIGGAPSGSTVPDASTIVDTTNPISSVDVLSTYTTAETFTVTATASDTNGVMIIELWYKKDGGSWSKYGNDTASPWSWDFDTSTTNGDGNYQFFTRSYDNPNNYEDVPVSNDTWTIVDTIKSSSSVDALSTYTTTGTFTITAIAFDTNGITKVEFWYNRDGTGWLKYGNDTASPWSWDFDTSTTGGEGIYQFYTRAYDSPNNYEDAPVSNDTWTIVDTTKPTVGIEDPSSESTITSSSVTVRWSGSDVMSGIDHFEVKIDGGEYVNIGLDTNYIFEGVSDGSHTITIKAVDNAGNSEEATLNIDVDTNPLSPTGPSGGLPLYLLIIIVVVCILLAIGLMKRKKKPVDTEPQEELQEATPPPSQESSQELPPTSPGQEPSEEGPPLPSP